VVAFVLSQATAGEEKQEPVEVRLELSTKEFNPSEPGKAVLRCRVRNRTQETLSAPSIYDDKTRLFAQGPVGRPLTLFLRFKAKFKPAKLDAGQEAVAFELPLGEILLPRGKDWPYFWEWDARPMAPLSPIYQLRNKGFVDRATFWVQTQVRGRKVTSPKVELKVKAPAKGAE
jgi:hypothetical protein